MLLDLSFPILEIFMPLICISVVIICCHTSCRALHRAWQERRDQQNMQDGSDTPPSVYIIPFPSALPYDIDDDDLYRPPRYSETEHTGLPPSYSEVEMKPAEFDITPDCPPPPYVATYPEPPSRSDVGA